ncbi:hypothetical protein E5288_WYG008023 [Bos mutus]|uniref:Coiled-coil-helix-coiled-coil-helix domain-containing protein 7 n=1 Tax=Bos mutus TaxID=72004 RepID=A0A6B0S1S1_9CETA|nr:hypothetical protein [Bos mutus]
MAAYRLLPPTQLSLAGSLAYGGPSINLRTEQETIVLYKDVDVEMAEAWSPGGIMPFRKALMSQPLNMINCPSLKRNCFLFLFLHWLMGIVKSVIYCMTVALRMLKLYEAEKENYKISLTAVRVVHGINFFNEFLESCNCFQNQKPHYTDVTATMEVFTERCSLWSVIALPTPCPRPQFPAFSSPPAFLGAVESESKTYVEGSNASRDALRIPDGCSCVITCGFVQSREKTLRMPMVTRRLRDPDVNPCLSESDASTRCMAENNYDKESCSSHFLKYKNCRKFWIVAVNQLGNAWFEMPEEHDIDVMTMLFAVKSKEEEG